MTIKIIILYNLFFSILILLHFKFQKFNLDINIHNDIKKIINFLNKNLKNARIFVNPFKESFIYLYYQSEGMLKNNLKFYNRLISRPNEIGFKYYLEDINSGNDKNFESFYQGTSNNLKKKYKITHIILDTSWLKFIPSSVQKLIKNDIKNKLVFKCNNLIVYKA